MPSRQLCSVISDLQQSQLGLVDHVGIRHTVVSHQRLLITWSLNEMVRLRIGFFTCRF